MRKSRSDDHWRHVYERMGRYSSRIEEVEFQDIPIVGSGTIVPQGGIVALCGANGTGKTSLLGAVLSCISRAKQPFYKDILQRASLRSSVKGQLRGEPFASTGEDSLNDEEGLVTFLEPAQFAARITHALTETTHIDELLSQYEEKHLTKDEVSEASYIARKAYRSITVREVEVRADQVVPYFTASTEAGQYNTLQMGRGELAVQLILWTLRSRPKGSFLLLEEPESYLPPVSQRALMDVVAKYSDKGRIWTLLTTHSPFILERIPDESVWALLPNSVLRADSQPDYLRTLGVERRKDGLLFVEDEAAKLLFELMARSSGRVDLLHRVYVHISGSDSQVINSLKGLPSESSCFVRFIGLLDGDCRARVGEFEGVSGARVFYLPGDVPPEDLILGAIKNDKNTFLDIVNFKGTDQGAVAFSMIEGLDRHDAISELAHGLGTSYVDVFTAGFRLWYSEEVNKTTADEVIEAVRGALSE